MSARAEEKGYGHKSKTERIVSGKTPDKKTTGKQQENTDRNLKEIESQVEILESYPRRLVFELTNACNFNCVMCGRNAADFKMTSFDMDVFCSFEPMMDIVEEVTLMGWGSLRYIPISMRCLRLSTGTMQGNISVAMV